MLQWTITTSNYFKKNRKFQQRIERVKKQKEDIKKNQMEILKVKKIVKVKSLVTGINGRM